jgi:DNA primase small subunit
VYHSAAYYQNPGAGTMKEKGWQGADLIFDLDADHLPQKARSYAEMLANVKAELTKLLDFLLQDFGFSENSMSIVFSGGRGYHIHVRDLKVQALESAERREIVDYVSGLGSKTEFLFTQQKHIEHREGKIKKIELDSPKKIISFEENDNGFGWGKRVSKYLVSFLRELSSKEEDIALGEISYAIYLYFENSETFDNTLKETACKIFQVKLQHPNWNVNRIMGELSDISNNEQFIKDIISYGTKARKIISIAKSESAINRIQNNGIIDFMGVPEFFEIILENTINAFGVQMGTKTDEPVTADVKRLIRMPSSLHGGSGMRVVPLTLSEFEKFEPLRDAVVFSEKEINVEVIPLLKPRHSLIEMKGKPFTITEGINTLPEYVAIYLMCQGAAEYA